MGPAACLLVLLVGGAADAGLADGGSIEGATGQAAAGAAGSSSADAVDGPSGGALEQRLAARLSKAVVVLRDTATKGHGTGWLVDNDGTVVTNAHVAVELRRPEAQSYDGTLRKVHAILFMDEAHDVALVRIDATGLEPLSLSPSPPTLAARVFYMGSPAGLDFTFATGRVSAFRPEGIPKNDRLGRPWEPTPKVQLDLASTGGASGSPVVDETGVVIGMIQSGLTRASNFAFAVPASSIAEVLSARPAASEAIGFSSWQRSLKNLAITAGAIVVVVLAWLFVAGRRSMVR